MIPENGSKAIISEGESCRDGKLHLPFAPVEQGMGHQKPSKLRIVSMCFKTYEKQQNALSSACMLN
jgi:hypothetical protein